MANQFSKQERVAYDRALEGFQDALAYTDAVTIDAESQTEMERGSDRYWRPQPYIMSSYAGMDQTANFKDVVQLSVPIDISFQRAVPFYMTARELRDDGQEPQLMKAARQRLGSDINISIMNRAAIEGTLVVKRLVAASGFDDVALIDSLMNEQGIATDDRHLILSSRDYNNMAGNLAGRQTLAAGKTMNAYERAQVGLVSGFETKKADYAYSLTAATATTVTVNGANQRYVPSALTGSPTTTERLNKDNRYQNLTVAVGGGALKIGDAFTIAGVFAVHHITKQSTGQLKTFRVVDIISGAGGSGVVKISPPIISADSTPTVGEVQYQNVTAAPAANAVVTLLNTTTAPANVFWHRDAMIMTPGRLEPRNDSGLAVMRGRTDQGFELLMTRQGDINTLNTKYRFDASWGVSMAQPEMAGIELFGQAA